MMMSSTSSRGGPTQVSVPFGPSMRWPNRGTATGCAWAALDLRVRLGHGGFLPELGGRGKCAMWRGKRVGVRNRNGRRERSPAAVRMHRTPPGARRWAGILGQRIGSDRPGNPAPRISGKK